jgi:hypothetical protein
MKSISKPYALLLLAVAAPMLLSACTPNVKKEDSYSYNEICERVAYADPIEMEPDAPGKYKEGSVARDIAQARFELNRIRVDYARFDCAAEHRNRGYDYSLLGTAIVAGGAALAKANAYILGGIGLGAGGIATAKSYLHPDSDRDAYITAYQQLTCLYDSTRPLKQNISVETLLFDRTAMHAAMSAVRDDLSKLQTDAGKPTDAETTAIKAAQAALDAGDKALAQIATTLADYKNLPATIFEATHTLNFIARKASATNGTYTSFSTSIKDAYSAAGKADAATQDTKKGIADAQSAGAVAQSSNASQPNGTVSLQAKAAIKNLLFSARSLNLSNVQLTTSCTKADDPTCGQLTFKADSQQRLIHVLSLPSGAEVSAFSNINDDAASHLSKLVGATTIATENQPSPSYAEIVAKITTCLPKL